MLAASVPQAPALAAPAAWLSEPAVQQRLAAGEVVVQSPGAVDPRHPRGWVRAAVRIRASAETVWRVVTDCAQAEAFVPGLRRCRRIDAAPDGSWADIEHEVRYSRLLPSVDYVFRAQYQRPFHIDFRRVSGDVKEEEGAWSLSESAGGSETVVEYEVYLDPGFWIPHFLVMRSLRKDLPTALSNLRERAEHASAR
jgi:uncharacterized protein YndB with AHSA1/START domain